MTNKTQLVSALERLGEYAEMLGDRYPAQAYRNAARTMQTYRGAVTVATEHEWANLPGIGRSIRSKIVEYLNTGTMEKIERYRKNPTIRAIQRLCRVKGLGPRRARELVRRKIRSVTDLRRAVRTGQVVLTHVQATCLRHHADLRTRIPASEMDWFATRLRQITRSVPDVTCQVVGSYRRYRRAAPRRDSGDIDVLLIDRRLTRLEQVKRSQCLARFVETLEKTLECKRLTLGRSKFWGLVRRSKQDRFRHLDIRLMPMESHATALLHMTGSKEFNRYLRTMAMQSGFRLSEYELKDMARNRRVPVRTERDVFRTLSVPYRSPGQRNMF